ncbi:transcriptional regulator with XRE-family HTH domain [Streptomyces canus]|uniref:Transcriptional regulator with XRE-family HTH domain n=1 Tax=Streptomyces canus TaxID=58343 RepID=A0AAW8FDG3_9ACTN|nr:transcriptional regulator with XRE-family HTH domain [Streptomyces canus]MDQ0908181.1 transcriptional regulator with XRE-family HTH domain [Streptomyces canus]
MPRWRALPDELDPQVREFASQLRRLVDRSGLSIAAVADRTGYSKTSWERYLNGRLLAPKGAIVALAEVTGTNPVHLTTMWELAERAWSRSEMRHDMTMEAIRISQARAALGEFGAPPANVKGGKTARRSSSATATPGVAGPAGVAPAVPPQPTSSEADSVEARQGSSGGNSWGMAGYQGPSQPSSGRTAAAAPVSTGGPGWTPGAPGTPGPYDEPQDARPGDGSSGGAGGPAGAGGSGGGKRRLTMFLAGVVGVLVVVAAVFFLTDGGGGKQNSGADTSPSPSASASVSLPAGVKCSGAGCTGKDAEAMGCSGNLVTTAKTATVGATVVEVRYSETCGAAWGRVTQAGQGDKVEVTAGKATEQSGDITEAGDTIAYTPMVAVKDAGEAKACVALASGQSGCTD